MYLSLDWLKDFVDVPKSITPEELGLRLTMHTVEIDSVEKQADKFANIVVGKILEIEKHPNADRLQITKIDAGKNIIAQNKPIQVVCGANNIKIGQLVPVALIGAILPNGMEITETEIRGVKSYGMLCAEDELGIGNDHSGILILENRAKIGQNLAQYLGLRDVIFEVDNKSITNRPDLWSHYGIAREIAAFLDVKFKKYNANPQIYANTANSNNANMPIDVKIEDYKLCPRYMAVAIGGIKIAESPKWMQERLIAVGMRPINNIVDITNYVMLELGQPLHAFDASLLCGKSDKREVKITIRQAKDNEIIETLDGEQRKLDKEMLVITDGKKPTAIAGVMGGVNSEINNETDSIIIESANFDFISIRKTQQKLGIRTESSMRFEKALDPNLCETAIIRATELIQKICPKAKIASKLIDESKINFSKQESKIIKLNLDWLNKKIGQEIGEKIVVKILERMGFVVKKNKNELEAAVPTWRATKDISIPEDLVEEVARIYGYDNLSPSMPFLTIKTPEINLERVLERKIKNILSCGARLTEVYNYSFVGQQQLEKLNLNIANYIKLVNPISSNQTMLRQNLTPNLLENIKINQDRFKRINLFEIGNIYLDAQGELQKNNTGKENIPYQEKRLGIIVAGDKKDNVFRKIKGIVEYLLTSLNLTVNFSQIEIIPNWADENVSAKIKVNQKYIGLITKLNSKIVKNIGIKKDVAIVELSLKELFNVIQACGVSRYQEFVKFPPAIRDLAFVINEKILYNDIRNEIINFSELIKEVDLFDVYSGSRLGDDKKSLAFHIIYQADKTLTAEEVDALQKKLIRHLEKKFEAKIRDF